MTKAREIKPPFAGLYYRMLRAVRLLLIARCLLLIAKCLLLRTSY